VGALSILVTGAVRLPSPPSIAVRILDVIKSEDFSFNDLAGIIQSDPALASRIMRLANSGLYAMPKGVSSIEKAIAVLGANAVKNIALSFVLSRVFQGPRGERFDFDVLWRRSTTAAVAGELLSAEIGFKSEDTFIATLLQDVGIAVMFLCRSDDYLSVLDEKVVTGLPITTVERRVFGFDHQEVGAELLKMWDLPENVYQAIRHHHDPSHAPRELKTLCDVVRTSDRLSAVYYGTGTARNVSGVKELLARTFGLSEARSATLIDAVAVKSVELLRQFDFDPGQLRPFSQILQDANEELSRLNLSFEVLVMEHKEAKQKAEQLARELQRANEKLRSYAFHDSLTGLYNFRYFQEAMAKELARAERHKHPVALLLFDVDDFKTINDSHGHQAGDFVLKSIGERLVLKTRSSDVVARYGGDEFVMILPETEIAGARIKAERCREAIETLEIKVDDLVIRTTLSVGVAVYDSHHAGPKDTLIDRADRGLYRSKRDGRNRVTVWSPEA
jgi:diguanylate cyclase (GGDEF)-like protein